MAKEKTGVSVNRALLVSMLKTLEPGVGGGGDVEQTTHLTFADGVAWSFNDEVAMSVPLPGNLDIEGAILADPFINIIRRSTGADVEISSDPNEIHIKCGKMHAGIVKEVSRLPIESIPLPKEGTWIDIPKEFVESIGVALRSCGKDRSLPVLSSLCMGNKRIIGCDNYHMTACSVPELTCEPWLFPASAAKYLEWFQPDAYARVSDWVHFINKDDAVLSCRCADGAYPDILPLLEVKGQKVTFPDGLIPALKRSSIFAEGSSDKDKEIQLSAEGKILTVKSKDLSGWMTETMAFPECKPFSLGVNPGMLLDAMTLGADFTVGPISLLITGKSFKHVIALSTGE